MRIADETQPFIIAPENPSVYSASIGINPASRMRLRVKFYVWIFHIDSLPSRFGSATSKTHSSLPGRSKAGSIWSRLLVVPITRMLLN